MMYGDFANESDKSPGEQLEEVRRAIAAHPGYRANAEWEGLRRIHKVLDGNYRELGRLLNRASLDRDYALELVQNVHESAIRDEFYSELDRLLHNFAAAIFSLVEHTMRVVRHYNDVRFRAEYERRKTEVVNSRCTAFIKDLRRYVQHYKLPPIYQEVSLGLESFESKLMFSVAGLLEWDGWTSPSRALLAGSGEGLALEVPIGEYARSVDGLYNWLFRQFDALHGREIDAANDLIDEHNRLLTGRSGPHPA